MPGTASPHRHCACCAHLIDVILGALKGSSLEHSALAANLMQNRGKTMISCPGTTLPDIDWAAVESSIKTLCEQALEAYDQEDISQRDPKPYASKISRSISRGIKSMWDITLRTPAGIGKRTRSGLILN